MVLATSYVFPRQRLRAASVPHNIPFRHRRRRSTRRLQRKASSAVCCHRAVPSSKQPRLELPAQVHGRRLECIPPERQMQWPLRGGPQATGELSSTRWHAASVSPTLSYAGLCAPVTVESDKIKKGSGGGRRGLFASGRRSILQGIPAGCTPGESPNLPILTDKHADKPLPNR